MRARVRLRLAAVAAAVTVLFAVPVPSQAELIGTLVDTTNSLVDTTTGLLVGTSGLLTGWTYDDSTTYMSHVNDVIGAPKVWRSGVTGAGVHVALVDTGVVPVQGLTYSPVTNGADISFESQAPDLRYLDTFGHGTHMAGIIAGRDGAKGGFRGVAPDAGLVALKLAANDGAVDVSQVVAAIDWVVAHRNDPGLNIRVLNLSYGTDGVQDYRLDPLTHAVQNAWRHGIVVVVSGGNSGYGSAQLNNPAYDPYVIAVGAGDTAGTVGTSDDTVLSFSSRGDAARRVDLVAPGRSIVSLRNPGSYLDQNHPGAVVDTRFFKGSGTSQAAAVVSGAAALLLQQRPSLTPDQVKSLLTSSASSMPKADAEGRGHGMLNVSAAVAAATPTVQQQWERSNGTGSIDAARGGSYVEDNGVELRGEQHILGPWDATTWPAASTGATSWSGGTWHGAAWTGGCWCGTSWTASTWATTEWTGASWGGADWQGRTWRDNSWDGRTWRGDGWAGRTWRSATWTGAGWSSAR